MARKNIRNNLPTVASSAMPTGIADDENRAMFPLIPAAAALLAPLFSGAGTKGVEYALAHIAKNPISIFPTSHKFADDDSATASWTLTITRNSLAGVVLTKFTVGNSMSGELGTPSAGIGLDTKEQVPIKSGARCTIPIPPGESNGWSLTVSAVKLKPAFIVADFEFYKLDSDEPILVELKLLLLANI